MKKKYFMAIAALTVCMLAGCAATEGAVTEVLTTNKVEKEDTTGNADSEVVEGRKEKEEAMQVPACSPTLTNTPAPTNTPTPIPKKATSAGYFDWFTMDDMDIIVLQGIKEGYKVPEEVVVPVTAYGKRVVLGAEAFSKCEEIKSVTIPETITEIPSEAFWCCSNLSEVYLPEGLTIIGKKAFTGCKSLKSITLPESLVCIEFEAFWDTGLCEVTIPSGVKEIGGYAFVNCVNLESVKFLGGYVDIDYGMFQLCKNLKKVVIPEGVTNIDDWAFASCESLEHIALPESLTRIGEGAFKDCASLTSIDIPSSVSYIGKDAFSGCISLNKIPATPTPTPTPTPSVDYSYFSNYKVSDNGEVEFEPKYEEVIEKGLPGTAYNRCIINSDIYDKLIEYGARLSDNVMKIDDAKLIVKGSIHEDTLESSYTKTVRFSEKQGKNASVKFIFDVVTNDLVEIVIDADSWTERNQFINELIEILGFSERLDLNSSRGDIVTLGDIQIRKKSGSFQSGIIWITWNEDHITFTRDVEAPAMILKTTGE